MFHAFIACYIRKSRGLTKSMCSTITRRRVDIETRKYYLSTTFTLQETKWRDSQVKVDRERIRKIKKEEVKEEQDRTNVTRAMKEKRKKRIDVIHAFSSWSHSRRTNVSRS